MSMNHYALPLRTQDIKDQRGDSPAHTGKLVHAIDFLCDVHSEILAAHDGEVVWVKDESNKGGNNRSYWNDGNRIVIKHEQGEYSAYEHLEYRGARVKVGDRVKQGDLIGYSGNTGYSLAPHLHMEVFRWTKENPDVNEDYETVPITWRSP